MSRNLVTSTSRLLLHPTLHPSPVLAFSNPRSHAFSTSSSASESRTRRRSRLVRKTNLEKKSSLAKAHQESQPDPVLGYAKGRESIWENSLLKSVLLRREDVWGETVKVLPDETASTSRRGQAPETIGGDKSSAQIAERTYFPKHFNFGLGEEEVKLLAEDLPIVASHRMFVGKEVSLFEQMTDEDYEKAVKAEEEKKDKLLRIVDLRNAGSKGIEFENMRRIVKAFGASETDTGSPEVQAAILTARIHSLQSHLTSQPRDVENRRPLRSLVQQRVKTLKYLRSLDVRRYETCLEKIGVEPRAVEGEIIVTKLGLRALIRPQA